MTDVTHMKIDAMDAIPSDAGIDADSVAIPRAVRAVARKRLLRPIGFIDPETLAQVEDALATVLGLDRLLN